jgi:glycosyltransferase involved in cell wall biosynthesis
MNVAYITSLYPSLSHSFILREVRALRAQGVEVRSFSVRRTPESQLIAPEDREEAAATRVLLPPRPRELAGAAARALAHTRGGLLRLAAGAVRRGLSVGPRAALWQLFYLGEAVLVWDDCRRTGVRHVHAHFANVGADVAQLVARIGGPGWTWSFTMHGPTEFFDVPGHRLADKTRDARFVACISDFCRSQLMKLVEREHWDKLHLVRCGVDPEVYAPPPPRDDDGTLRVVCVGRLVPDKGQSLLVDAIGLLRARGVDARLELVGDGPDRAHLDAHVRELGLGDAVVLAGAVGQDTIRDHYAAADVFCLPSFAEGVPVVLMEAMAMGMPVVTTRIAGIGELVEDGISGVLVRPGRADLLADALQGLTDPETRRRMGAAGRAMVVREFDVARSAAVLAGILRDRTGTAA